MEASNSSKSTNNRKQKKKKHKLLIWVGIRVGSGCWFGG